MALMGFTATRFSGREHCKLDGRVAYKKGKKETVKESTRKEIKMEKQKHWHRSCAEKGSNWQSLKLISLCSYLSTKQLRRMGM